MTQQGIVRWRYISIKKERKKDKSTRPCIIKAISFYSHHPKRLTLIASEYAILHEKEELSNIIITYDITVFIWENKLILLQPQIHLHSLAT